MQGAKHLNSLGRSEIAMLADNKSAEHPRDSKGSFGRPELMGACGKLCKSNHAGNESRIPAAKAQLVVRANDRTSNEEPAMI
jgi:hypothetical protein